MNYDNLYKRQPRVTASSAILLTIFVAAALVMLAIVVWKPLVHQPTTSAVSAGEASPAAVPETLDPAASELSSP